MNSTEIELTLEQYTKVIKKIAKFKQEHIEVFVGLEKMEEAKTALENVLKEQARDFGSVENKDIKVKVVEVYKKWYDFKLVEKFATPKELKYIMENCAIVEIDKSEFEKAVKNGDINPELMHQAFKEEKQSSRVQIQELE